MQFTTQKLIDSKFEFADYNEKDKKFGTLKSAVYNTKIN